MNAEEVHRKAVEYVLSYIGRRYDYMVVEDLGRKEEMIVYDGLSDIIVFPLYIEIHVLDARRWREFSFAFVHLPHTMWNFLRYSEMYDAFGIIGDIEYRGFAGEPLTCRVTSSLKRPLTIYHIREWSWDRIYEEFVKWLPKVLPKSFLGIKLPLEQLLPEHAAMFYSPAELVASAIDMGRMKPEKLYDRRLAYAVLCSTMGLLA